MRIGVIVSAVFVVALSGLAARADDLLKPADNPLLGGWQLMEETDLDHIGGHCATGMKFEPTQQTDYLDAQSFTGAARYMAYKGAIVVPGKNGVVEGGLLSYRITGKDQMERRDYLLCTYRRGDPSKGPAPPGCPSPEELEAMQHPDPSTPLTYDQAMLIIRCTP